MYTLKSIDKKEIKRSPRFGCGVLLRTRFTTLPCCGAQMIPVNGQKEHMLYKEINTKALVKRPLMFLLNNK